MEELCFVHANRFPASIRKFDYWNSAYVNATEAGKSVFTQRDEKYILMNPKKRQVVNKLLAMRSLLEGVSKQSKKRKHEKRLLARAAANPIHSGSSSLGAFPRPQSAIGHIIHEVELDHYEEQHQSLLAQTKEYVQDLEVRTDVLLTGRQRGDPSALPLPLPEEVVEGGGNLGEGNSVADKQAVVELYFLWDEIIGLCESDRLPGLSEKLFSEVEIENWYTFRACLVDVLRSADWELAESESAQGAGGMVEKQFDFDMDANLYSNVMDEPFDNV
jgi:hypothetical protein